MLRVQRKEIKKNEPIRCMIDTANDAAEISLDENVTREAKFATDITNARKLKREADSMATSTAASIEQMALSITDIARSMTTTKDAVDLASDSAKSIVSMIAELVAAGEKMSSIST